MRTDALSGKSAFAAGQNIKEREYWLNQLAGQWIKGSFPYDNHNSQDLNERALNTEILKFPEELASRLVRLSNQSDHRLYMILVTGLVVLLHKYTGHKDIVIGAPIYKQKRQGEFINTVLPLRNRFDSSTTFKELLLQVRQTIFEASQHQNYPMEALIYKLNLAFTDGDFPLFDLVILLENVHDKSYIKHLTPKLLMCFLKSDTDLVSGQWQYNPVLYRKSFIKAIGSHFIQVLEHALCDVNQLIADIEMLSAAEQKQLLQEFNNTGGEFPENQTIHRWFEEQVEKKPDQIALVGDNAALTYRELNKRPNQLAHVLREKGIKPGAIVALMAERSLEMIIGLLAILKAGGAYLPVDPHYPGERKEYMFMDSHVQQVLTNHDKDQLEYLPTGIEIIDLRDERVYPGKGNNLDHCNRAADPVYLIYTSGSTGKAKGVMLEHHNLVNLIYFDFFHTTIDTSKILQFHTLSFDASIHEICCALLSGGGLVLIKEETRSDIPGLLEIVEKNQVKTLFLPMSFIKLIFSEDDYIRGFPGCVRHIQTAGEQVVTSPRFRRFLQENTVYFHNHYGPSETHVVTALTMEPSTGIPRLPSIGKPVLNTIIYILNKQNQLLPVDVPGELAVGGVQVGRGYLNRPELTAERFKRAVISHSSLVISSSSKTSDRFSKLITNDQCPMTNDRSFKLYHTGDLARWLGNGEIEFLGRIDNQVKIRGFRVEPGEIEKRLLNHIQIKEAVVVPGEHDDGDKHLCAYFVGSKSEEISVSLLREYLAEALPDYMVPAYFIQLAQMPLTPSGKINRQALPSIDTASLEKTYRAPRNEMEKKLCQLWAEVLEIETSVVGIDDNFFELGGHSLKATILLSKIHKTFNVKTSLEEVFNQPTIRGLAQCIRELAEDWFVSIEPAEKKDYYPLSSAQRRLYIQQQVEIASVSYNMPICLVLEGQLHREKLAAAFRQLIHRHENLRTSFRLLAEEPVQRIHDHDEVAFEIEYDDLATENTASTEGEPAARSPQSAAALISSFMRPFDLSKPPLLRAALIRQEHQQHILAVEMHHIISDGISLEILSREFLQLYSGKILPPLTLQYKDFSEWQNQLLRSGELEFQEQYWLNRFDGDIPVLQLPTDFPRPPVLHYQGDRLFFDLDQELTVKINELVINTNTTFFVLWLTVCNILLWKYTQQEDIVVGTAAAGRRHTDLDQVIGMFVNMLALRNQVQGNKTFISFLKEINENTLQALSNQDFQFEDLVRKLNLQRNPARNPLFDVAIHTINMEIPEMQIPGLKLKPYPYEAGTSRFDLVIGCIKTNGNTRMYITYSTALFKQSYIEDLQKHLVEILDQVLENPQIQLADLRLSTKQAAVDSTIPREETLFQF